MELFGGPENWHCDSIHLLLLATPTIISGIERKWKRSDSSDFDSVELIMTIYYILYDYIFILGRKRSYEFDYDFIVLRRPLAQASLIELNDFVDCWETKLEV